MIIEINFNIRLICILNYIVLGLVYYIIFISYNYNRDIFYFSLHINVYPTFYVRILDRSFVPHRLVVGTPYLFQINQLFVKNVGKQRELIKMLYQYSTRTCLAYAIALYTDNRPRRIICLPTIQYK